MLRCTAALAVSGTFTGLLGKGAWARTTVTVKVTQGRLAGVRAARLAVFKGIPYGGNVAAGSRFLQAPPPSPWGTLRVASDYGSPSLQNNVDYPAWLDPKPGAENCLYLNVWTPDTAGKRAVMVWIHGGGYSVGSGGLPLYDGSNLAEKGDVVVVTVNHRLNIFGYLHLAAFDRRYETSGNAGQLDLVQALEWIAANISAFGGDPGNVTIFGESGGGAKISTLMAMPAAQGLFHKAIIESAAPLSALTPEAAERTGRAVLAHFGFATREVAKLQSVPADKLLAASVRLAGDGTSTQGERHEFGPVVDGVAIPRQTWTPGTPEISRHIPMLVGSNHDEAVTFVGKAMYDAPMDDAALGDRIKRYSTSGTPLRDSEVNGLISRYRRTMPSASSLDLLVRIATDVGMRHRAIRLAERQLAGGAPVFMYEFDWRTPCFGGRWALHSVEIPFAFGNLDYGTAWDDHDTDAKRAAADPVGARFRLSDQTLRAWAAFARTGNPSHSGLPQWRPYALDRRETMSLNVRSELLTDPRRADRLFVENLVRA